MAEKVKKYSKKLRGRETIQVDTQLQLWRKKLKKLGLTSGRHQDQSLKHSRKHVEKVKTEEAIVEGRINFFGLDNDE